MVARTGNALEAFVIVQGAAAPRPHGRSKRPIILSDRTWSIKQSEAKCVPLIVIEPAKREAPRDNRFHGGLVSCSMLLSQATPVCLAPRGASEYVAILF